MKVIKKILIKEIFDDKNGVHHHLLSEACYVQQKMVDIIFIVKNLFYLKFFITFINATKVYSIYIYFNFRPCCFQGLVPL